MRSARRETACRCHCALVLTFGRYLTSRRAIHKRKLVAHNHQLLLRITLYDSDLGSFVLLYKLNVEHVLFLGPYRQFLLGPFWVELNRVDIRWAKTITASQTCSEKLIEIINCEIYVIDPEGMQKFD